MIIRKIKTDPDKVLETFDFFNDYDDTLSWAVHYCTVSTLEKMVRAYIAWMETKEKNDLLSVGNNDPKKVTKLNNELFLKAKEIMDGGSRKCCIGWASVGAFIDYLEENYNITRKEV